MAAKKKSAGATPKASAKKVAAAKVAAARPTQTRVAGKDFPQRSLERAVAIASALHTNHPGASASTEELAANLNISSGSANFKYILWAASAYGLVNKDDGGGYTLAETGRKLVSPNYEGEDSEARVKAVLTPAVLSKFYTDHNGHQLPTDALFPNVLENKYGLPREKVGEAKTIIVANATYARILVEGVAGEPASISFSGVAADGATPPIPVGPAPTAPAVDEVAEDWSKTCFFITPIGDEASEFRKHADMILKHLVTPAAAEHGLTVVRADKIEKSGLITQQILEHIVRARLCITDLSFRNANVFYELGIRHMTLLPAIQIIKKGDTIPFDVSQGRTITVDTSDVYTVVDRLDSAKRELSEHIKNALSSEAKAAADDNPIAVYMPGLKVTIPA